MTCYHLPVSDLAELRERRARAVSFLLGHLRPDGALGDPSEGFFFYRAPWTFCRVGEAGAAVAVCRWVRSNMLNADGTLGGPYRLFDDAYLYRDATLLVGAQLAHE